MKSRSWVAVQWRVRAQWFAVHRECLRSGTTAHQAALYGQAQWNLETLVSAGTICYPLLSALDCCSTLLQSMGLEAPKPAQSDQAALLENNLGCPSWPLVRHAYPYQACLLPCLLPCLVPTACRLSCRAGTQCPASAALTH